MEMNMIENIIGVNLIGSFNIVKAALAGMKKRTDRRPVSIAFMSSQLGQVGIYGYTAYSASKFGLSGFCRSIATRSYC
ncbi:putative 3-dehydrosphinganine reductase [Helianthus annuus]|nr:putative 3-dehydrosphinganine reductase [Helianthus annuus]